MNLRGFQRKMHVHEFAKTKVDVFNFDKLMFSDIGMYLHLPDTPNTSRRVLRGVRAKMALIFSPNNQNIACKDVLIT